MNPPSVSHVMSRVLKYIWQDSSTQFLVINRTGQESLTPVLDQKEIVHHNSAEGFVKARIEQDT